MCEYTATDNYVACILAGKTAAGEIAKVLIVRVYILHDMRKKRRVTSSLAGLTDKRVYRLKYEDITDNWNTTPTRVKKQLGAVVLIYA